MHPNFSPPSRHLVYCFVIIVIMPTAIDWSAVEHTNAKIVYIPTPKKKANEKGGGNHFADQPKPEKKEARGGTMINFDELRKNQVKEMMNVYDARPNIGNYDLDTHGYIIASGFKTALPQTLEVMKDPKEVEITKTFLPEVEAMAKEICKLGDGRLPKYAFALGTQKFIPQPRLEGSAGIRYQGDDGIAISYSRNAHADFTEVVFDSAYKMLTKRGVPEEEAKSLDLVFVNTWKPYGQTVHDNPLALLDWTSVDAAKDVHIQKRGMKTKKGNIYGTQLSFNPNHKWAYLPEQRDDEILFFKQADSRAENKQPHNLAQYGFHTSFLLPNDPGPEMKTRRSIATRLLLGYEKNPSARL